MYMKQNFLTGITFTQREHEREVHTQNQICFIFLAHSDIFFMGAK